MIPVEEIPHLMCALGYFPTQLEITNMTNEVKYSKFAETSDLGGRHCGWYLCLQKVETLMAHRYEERFETPSTESEVKFPVKQPD